MWVWRAFIFSLSIALFTAISLPASALENSPSTQNTTAYILTDLRCELGNTDNTNSFSQNTPLSPALLSSYVLPKSKLNSLPYNEKSAKRLPSKAPAYESRFDPNISLPPFERQAASTFGSMVQSEPIFVLAYEFLPEVLGLKHFLAPLGTHSAVPWYLRPDAAINHNRLAGWKDGNTLYTGSITYLS
ncbi:hypothetical protein QX776_04525 [Alteromonadaceae bacterium BrNp21-10]|nr:hypothetical protein [Alteromonadaceae bacterium BrNp21-10]